MVRAAVLLVVVIMLAMLPVSVNAESAYTILGRDAAGLEDYPGQGLLPHLDLTALKVKKEGRLLAIRFEFVDLAAVGQEGSLAKWEFRRAESTKLCCIAGVSFGLQPRYWIEYGYDRCKHCDPEKVDVQGRYDAGRDTVIVFVPLKALALASGDIIVGCPPLDERRCGRGYFSALTSAGMYSQDVLTTIRSYVIP